MKHLLFYLLIVCAISSGAQTVTRGPYLQKGNQSSITIRWRTNIATDTKVRYGTTFGSLGSIVSNATATTEHEISITGLSTDTKYYYSIGSTISVLQETNQNYFVTAPASTPNRVVRILAFGDCGNASTNQINVRKAFRNYLGTNSPDAWILLGDNAYPAGLDNEFQTGFFDIYKDTMLKNIKLYPATGNHDYGNTQANAALRNLAYYNMFTMPTAAECGGVASGTEAYYSFDIGNIHFISLDSYGKENSNTTRLYDTTGAQVTWLKADLAANTLPWTVAYFHHPPFTKGGHDCDATSGTDLELRNIREKTIRILERYGVDLVLCGHSHAYERTYFQKGFYGDEGTYNSSYRVSSSTGKYNASANSCPYYSSTDKRSNGTMYIVTGSSGQLGGSSTGYPYDAMYYSNNTEGGAFYFEVDNNRLDAKFICADGVIRDQFTMMKDVNKKLAFSASNGLSVSLTASYVGSYNWSGPGASGSTKTISVTPPSNATTSYIVNDALGCVADTFVITAAVALPVALHSFDVIKDNDHVNLKWKSETNNTSDHFIVERSFDGSTYQTIAGIPVISGQTNYFSNDSLFLDKQVYYRLKMIDHDNTWTTLGMKSVLFKSNKNVSVEILSAQQLATIYFETSVAQTIGMSIYSVDGKLVLGKKIHLMPGETQEKIKLPAGTYIMKCSGSFGSLSKKFIVR